MENVSKLLRMVFSAIVFCMGMLLMITKAMEYHKLLWLCRERLKQDVIYEGYNMNLLGDESVPYAELIATLLYPLEYDIAVDGQVIRRSEHQVAQIDSYGIRQTDYRKSYQYDENGNITMIIYHSGEDPR